MFGDLLEMQGKEEEIPYGGINLLISSILMEMELSKENAKGVIKKRFVKKNIAKPKGRPNDIYINTKSTFKAQRKHCENLFNCGYNEIYLHCLGKSITLGLNLTLDIIKAYNDILTYAIHTSTIHITDELHPLSDEDDITIQKRKNSVVHIKIYRKNPLNLDIIL